MSFTESGLAVAGHLRGVTFETWPSLGGTDRDGGVPAVREDGVLPRSSGRPDIYPYAVQERGASDHRALVRSRSAQLPGVTGRLDEVTAPGAAEKAAAAEVPAMRLAVRPAAPALAAE